MALNLTRAVGQSLRIGDVLLTVLEIRGGRVKFGFTAPPEIPIRLAPREDNDDPLKRNVGGSADRLLPDRPDPEPAQRPAGGEGQLP